MIYFSQIASKCYIIIIPKKFNKTNKRENYDTDPKTYYLLDSSR